MGGIAGVVRLGGDEAVVRAQLDRQLAAIPYRGEVVTRHVAGAAVLASIRRATDCAGSAEGGPGLAVVADARLDGRAALIDQLSIGVPAATLKDGGDARLILEAYRRWGEGCAAHLSGDFAFAVWDAPQRTLYLARDRTGVKQLYLHRDSTMLAFASEIRAVLAVPGVSRRLNRAALADHLLDVMEEAEATLFDAVTRLTPGHWLRAGLDGVRTEPYWALDSRREIRLGGDDQYAEAYRLALAESVGDRLRSRGRVGAMLSGGLDSSSIAATARGLQPGDSSLPVFNAVFTRLPPSLDAPFVEALLAQGGYEAHRVPIGTTGPLSAMTPDRDDEPLRVPGLALQLALYAAARDAGCTAILDGDGGDDAVSHGTARLAELSRAGRAGALVREARALRARTGTPMRSTLVSWGVRPLVPEPVLRARRVLWGRDPWGAALATPINPDFARSIDLPARLAALTGQTAGVPRSAREEHHRLLTTGLTAHSLGVLDRAAARVPVEPRYPFLDHRLLELCLALPSDQKLSDGWTRVVARRAMAGILPDEVRWRGGKAAMTGAMVEGLRSVDGTLLREIVEGDGPVWEFADRAATRAVHRRFLERPHGRDALVMWLIASTDLWLRNQRDTPE